MRIKSRKLNDDHITYLLIDICVLSPKGWHVYSKIIPYQITPMRLPCMSAGQAHRG
jgi:hypothetical protein